MATEQPTEAKPKKKATQPANSDGAVQKPAKPPFHWGVTDLQALQSWQGQTVEVHLMTGKVLKGELVGYGDYVLTVKVGQKVIVINKGSIAWYTQA